MPASAAAWYLRAHDDDRPLGIYIRDHGDMMPSPGDIIESEGANQTWRRAEVVTFEALPHACSMPRYTVVVRILELAT